MKEKQQIAGIQGIFSGLFTEIFAKGFEKRDRRTELENLVSELKSKDYKIPASVTEELGKLRAEIRLEDEYWKQNPFPKFDQNPKYEKSLE